MKKNSWKTLLSVVLLLTMLVSMLPFAAFAEDGQTAAAQTEEPAKTGDVPKVEEKTGDTPKADDRTGAAKTDEKSGDTAKDAEKAEDKGGDTSKDDAAKDESKDAPKGEPGDEAKDAPIGDTENPPMGEAEDTDAQIAALEAETEVEVQSDEQFTVTYKANYKADYTGGTVPEDIIDTVTIGETHTVRSSVTFHAPNGWLFVTWNTAADGSGTNIAPNTTLTENTTLYAQWEPTPKTPYWAGLTISMSVAPANPKLNEPFTYTVTVTNGTGFDLRNVIVEDTLPANVSAEPGTSDDWTFALSRNPSVKGVSFNDTLTAGSEASFNITAKFETGSVTTAINTAKIVSADYENSGLVGSPTASATATLSGIDWSKLTIEKKVDKDTALPGETLNYTITVTNNTGCDLSYICVKDTFPSCIWGFSGTDSNVKWKYTTRPDSIEAKLQDGLKAGTNAFFSVEATLTSNASGTAVNTAQITEAKSEHYTMPSGVGNIATATTSIERAPGLDLSGLTISVTPNTSIADIGKNNIIYTVTVTNNTGIDLDRVYVEYTPPQNLTSSRYPGDRGHWYDSGSPNSLFLSNGLKDKDYASYIVKTNFISVKPVTTAVNKATITGVLIGNDTISGNFGTAYAEVYSLMGLTIKKTVDKSTAKPGDTLTYTVEVTNNTDTDLDEVYVEDSLPGTLAYTGSTLVDGATGTLSHDSQLGTVTAKVTGLKKGAAAKYTVTAKVNADASGEISSLAKITKAVRGTDTVDITTTKEASAKTTVYTPVPVNVTVLFAGLKDVSQVPAGYKLTGADDNPFLKGEIKLDPAESKTGHVFRKFSTEEYVRLGQEYSLSFTQSDYDIPGYICTLTTETDPIKVTAQDAIAGINVEITLSYVKENLYTYPSLTVRTYFKGLAKLPDSFGYKLNCVSAPEDAIAFQGPLALTPGTENGVPYLEFSAKNVTLQAGTELTFSFTQSGYDVPGYLCALGSSTFKFTLPVPTTDVRQPILLKIENTYTQPDWSKLTITKTADKTSATPGSVVNYTVTVTNNTGVDLSNITVADTLDSRLRYSDSTGDYDTGTGTWTVASLANGKSVTLTLTVKLKYALAAGTVIENTASVTEAAAAGLIYDLSGQRLNDSVSVTVTSGKGSPRTGDDSNLGLWIAVMAASLACAGAAAVIYKKRRG